LQAHNLLLELFLAIDWSKALYRMGRDPQPQELTIAKGVRQGEDFENGRGRAIAFHEQDALAASTADGPILFSGIGPLRLPAWA